MRVKDRFIPYASGRFMYCAAFAVAPLLESPILFRLDYDRLGLGLGIDSWLDKTRLMRYVRRYADTVSGDGDVVYVCRSLFSFKAEAVKLIGEGELRIDLKRFSIERSDRVCCT